MAQASAITGIDHVLVGVGDLEAARRAWRGLGFTLTPRGRHVGWGTANYCIVFEADYIELLGILDPALFTNGLDRFLETREGLLGLALASHDAAAVAAALADGGIAVGEVKDLARILELPGGEARPAFKLLHLPASMTPGVASFVCQHLTPELIWRAPWRVHPNGARGVVSVTCVIEDPSAVAIPYGELFGFDRVRVGDGYVEADSGRGVLRFTAHDGLHRLHPGVDRPPRQDAPWLAALRLAVADPDQTAGYLMRAGVDFRRDADGTLRIAPALTHGVILEFAQAPGQEWP